MPTSTQQHPCLLVLNGHAAARAELRAAVAENRPAKLASHFLGALGEVHAAKILGASHVSHKVDECDLELNQVAIEVKSTARSRIDNVNLAGKECDVVCFVRCEASGEELWLVEVFTRPRGNGSRRVTNKHRTYHLEPKDRYRVIW